MKFGVIASSLPCFSYICYIVHYVVLGTSNLDSNFFFKQMTAYEMRISDWSSDVCSSDLLEAGFLQGQPLFVGVLGDLGGVVVADLGRERGDEHQRAADEIGDLLLVRFDPVDAAFGETGHAHGREMDRSQHVGAGPRHEYV